MQSYNEDIEGYQIPEDPSIQISSDDEGTAAHGSWQDGAAKRGAKRKHAWSADIARCAACAAEAWRAGIEKIGGYTSYFHMHICTLAPASMPLDILAGIMCAALLCTHTSAQLPGETCIHTCRGRGRGAGQQIHVKTDPDSWALAPGEHP